MISGGKTLSIAIIAIIALQLWHLCICVFVCRWYRGVEPQVTALPHIEPPSTQISYSPTPQLPDITGGEKHSKSSHESLMLSWRNTASGSWFIQVRKIRDNFGGYFSSWACAMSTVQDSKIYWQISSIQLNQVLGWALMTNGQSHDLLTILAKVVL